MIYNFRHWYADQHPARASSWGGAWVGDGEEEDAGSISPPQGIFDLYD